MLIFCPGIWEEGGQRRPLPAYLESPLTIQGSDEVGLSGLARHRDSSVGQACTQGLAGQEAQVLLRLRSRTPVGVGDARLATVLARLATVGDDSHTLASGMESFISLGKFEVEHGISLGYTTE
jgi:hypothetical protein